MPRVAAHKRGPASLQGPTIRDVAQAAGVSVATVSRVLAGGEFVKPATRERVDQAIDDLGYVVNAFARALTGQGSRTVGMVTAAAVGPSFSDLAQGAEEVAASKGHVFLLATTGGDVTREESIVAQLCQLRAATVILAGAGVVAPSYDERIRRYSEELARVGGRLVLCGRPPIPAPSPPVVSYDNEQAMFELTNHLIELGHRRFLVLGAEPGHSTAQARAAGFRRALESAGLECGEREVPAVAFESTAVGVALRRHLSEGPRATAVMGLADHLAVAALRVLREMHIAVPDEISLTGFDDIPLVADLTPALTTVRVSFADLGRMAAEAGLDSETPPAVAMLPGSVVVRESSASPRPEAG